MFEKVRAGFAVPETEVAGQAYRFAGQIEPAFVSAHSVPSYLDARELAGRGPFQDYDDELLFLSCVLSCVLHDVGLTEQGNREQRFEVDGADLAARFLRERGVDERRARIVWEAVALHTSDGIASRMDPEIALVQVGILADILGLGRDELPTDLVNRALRVPARRPRIRPGRSGRGAGDGQAEQATPMSLPGHLVRWHQPIGTLPDWYGLVSAAGWGDRPAAARQEGTATTPDQLARCSCATWPPATWLHWSPCTSRRPRCTPSRAASCPERTRSARAPRTAHHPYGWRPRLAVQSGRGREAAARWRAAVRHHDRGGAAAARRALAVRGRRPVLR